MNAFIRATGHSEAELRRALATQLEGLGYRVAKTVTGHMDPIDPQLPMLVMRLRLGAARPERMPQTAAPDVSMDWHKRWKSMKTSEWIREGKALPALVATREKVQATETHAREGRLTVTPQQMQELNAGFNRSSVSGQRGRVDQEATRPPEESWPQFKPQGGYAAQPDGTPARRRRVQTYRRSTIDGSDGLIGSSDDSYDDDPDNDGEPMKREKRSERRQPAGLPKKDGRRSTTQRREEIKCEFPADGSHGFILSDDEPYTDDPEDEWEPEK